MQEVRSDVLHCIEYARKIALRSLMRVLLQPVIPLPYIRHLQLPAGWNYFLVAAWGNYVLLTIRSSPIHGAMSHSSSACERR
jgi:hypothetical protein